MQKKFRLKACTLFIVTFFSLYAKGANYYFSSISGDDTRTSIQAQNPATPWKTIGKLNSFFPNLLPGDSVLFKKGEVFPGTINVSASGSINLSIVLSAFGTGNKPVITGFTTLQNWVNVGNSVWESTCSACSAHLNLVQINGVSQVMGRYPNITAPNNGYLTYESSNGNTQIIDNELSSSPNWTGAEVVIRKNRYIIDRNLITAHSGNTITYNTGSSYYPTNNFGYFIQNHPATLDQNGEWYYDPASKKVKIYYSSGDLNSQMVNASSVDLLVGSYSENNVVFDNLSFSGANVETFEIYDATNFKLKNCDLFFVGYDAIYAESTNQFSMENCSIQDAGNNALYLANNCSNSVIRNNKIKRTGIRPGTGYSGNNSSQAITIYGESNLVEYNEIDSTGYTAIRFDGSYNNIKNNFINYFTLTKDDGGGIYNWTGEQNTTAYVGRKVTGNIVINGIGAIAGTNNPDYIPSEGIYMDDNSKNVEITNNTVAFCNQSGILIHNSANLPIRNNTLFNNSRQLLLLHDNISPNSPLRNLDIKNNILFSKNATSQDSHIETLTNDISQFGTIDSNYYCGPVNQNALIFTRYLDGNNIAVDEDLSLQGWKTKYGKDLNSVGSPVKYSSNAGDSIRFEYNATQSVKSVVLSGTYVDVNNTTYSGTINLAPFTSIVLILKPACTTNNWLGSVDNSWQNPLNWSCGIVPDANTNVTIASGTPFNCIIDYPAVCRSLTVQQGAFFRANKNLTVKH